MPDSLIKIENLSKSFQNGTNEVFVLKDINFTVSKGEILAITGKSGSGKSTLLSIMAGLDPPTLGSVLYLGDNLYEKRTEDLDYFRSYNIGIIFQNYNLINEITCQENIEVPIIFAKNKKLDHEKILSLLRKVKLQDKANLYPAQMSGGEQQRVAVARAIVNEPYVIFADEPTGSLDTKNAENIMELLKSLRASLNTTIVIVTHDKDIATKCDRRLEIKDGRLDQA